MTELQTRALYRAILIPLLVFSAVPAFAHCDTLNGPVVAAARGALAADEVTQVLKWVRPEYEVEVRDAFAKTRKVRAQSPEARDLADRYFFETVVRLHRTGEGEPYTGLKEAGDVEPGIAAADRALATGDISPLLQGVPADVASAIRERFTRVQQSKLHADDDLPSGRAYVAAYIDFIHSVETLHTGDVFKLSEVSQEQPQNPEPPPATRAEIAVFTAANTRLKKNAETKVMLAFVTEPSGAKLDWRLTCQGVAINGWSSKQVLSVVERQEQGAVQAIEGRDFLGTNPAIAITIKRLKDRSAGNEASCVASVRMQGLEPEQKAMHFELR